MMHWFEPVNVNVTTGVHVWAKLLFRDFSILFNAVLTDITIDF